MISIDNGPGMTDVTRMEKDGYSTKNTLGQGLGAMKRLSDVFLVYSQKAWGTVILIRLYKEELPRFKQAGKIEVRSVVIPKPGETNCGDGFYCLHTKEYIKVFLGDGLGHGPAAEKAVKEAGNAFVNCPETDPVE